jgi:NAD(P)-dependent dehydrogenase (short-subunit alcohol dehydrogenase family)
VIIAGRNEVKLKESISSLSVNPECILNYMVLDSLDSQLLKGKVRSAFEQYRIDIWINCAGILKKTDRDRKFRGVDAETYFEVVNTNLKSNMLLIPYVADEMVSHGIKGSIVTVSSICGFTNHFGYTPYGISKNGVIEYTKQIAKRYKDKICILSVAPGAVATRMGTTSYGKNISGTSSFTHHTAIPEETASVIAFLSSAVGKHLSGQTVLVSAGERV